MATSRFKGFGWLLGIAIVTPACYMVSSMVAAERGRVQAVELAILDAKRDIRALETEFDTRASLAQLERWNGDVLALSAPRPEQYLPTGMVLASLRPFEGVRSAGLVVPSATDVAQAVVKPVVQPAVQITTPAVNPIEARTPALDVRPVIVAARPGLQKAVATDVAPARGQAVAMVSSGLLSDATFGDLVSGARGERAKLR
ncbi:hypothetical protein [Sphingomonas sp.]|uniref:hypothetical protein n=1 Tax=Sphingomonas sp. TaxID=28214 RepID=UPI002DD640B9|nr:hypothetical protein [Sphingomonas sp.]